MTSANYALMKSSLMTVQVHSQIFFLFIIVLFSIHKGNNPMTLSFTFAWERCESWYGSLVKLIKLSDLLNLFNSVS